MTRHSQAQAIRDAYDRGAHTTDAIARATGSDPNYVRQVCAESGRRLSGPTTTTGALAPVHAAAAMAPSFNSAPAGYAAYDDLDEDVKDALRNKTFDDLLDEGDVELTEHLMDIEERAERSVLDAYGFEGLLVKPLPGDDDDSTRWCLDLPELIDAADYGVPTDPTLPRLPLPDYPGVRAQVRFDDGEASAELRPTDNDLLDDDAYEALLEAEKRYTQEVQGFADQVADLVRIRVSQITHDPDPSEHPDLSEYLDTRIAAEADWFDTETGDRY